MLTQMRKQPLGFPAPHRSCAAKKGEKAELLLELTQPSLLARASVSNRAQMGGTISTQVGKVQLQPGTYKVEWQHTGPNSQVTFLQGKKVVTTVAATIKTSDPQVHQDDVITDQASSNREILREIDFSHGKDAVILHKGA